jgi:peptidoglycan/xylan/chitin deacetylase (PgdA/CDA1 family)
MHAPLRSRLGDAAGTALAWLHAHGLSLQPARSRPGRRIPILSFHRVSQSHADHWMTVSPAVFETLMRAVQRRYRIVSLAEVDRLLAAREDVAPTAAVTFDDAYGCNHTFAVPVLRKLQIPATFFVSSDFVDSSKAFPHDVAAGFHELPNFTSAQLRDMASDSLFEIGSHSVTHIDFATQPAAGTIQRELAESRQALAAISGRPVRRFAVPFGGRPQCTPELIRAARELGYERAYSFFGGSNLIAPDGRVAFVLNRLGPARFAPSYVFAMCEGYEGRQTFSLQRRAEAPIAADFQPSGF